MTNAQFAVNTNGESFPARVNTGSNRTQWGLVLHYNNV
ncbi:MAG: hypothetical protein EWM72_02414 [Nitrospira sp.]|nr:MAG: hypothetical protein EWM72_02414 [Nitrospira sp.]